MATLDDRILTRFEARRLAELGGCPADELDELTVGRARARLGAQLADPTWLLFRRLTGRVSCAPPGAVVEIAASECDLVTFFPGGWRWGWLFPFRRRDEVVARASTGGRGEFEVWLPRFHLEYLARWRRRHYGFAAVYERRDSALAAFPGAARETVAAALRLTRDELADFDPARRIGPIVRPDELAAPQWGRLRDVPDLTLRVRADGATLHDGGCFEIAWHRPDLTLAVTARPAAAVS